MNVHHIAQTYPFSKSQKYFIQREECCDFSRVYDVIAPIKLASSDFFSLFAFSLW